MLYIVINFNLYSSLNKVTPLFLKIHLLFSYRHNYVHLSLIIPSMLSNVGIFRRQAITLKSADEKCLLSILLRKFIVKMDIREDLLMLENSKGGTLIISELIKYLDEFCATTNIKFKFVYYKRFINHYEKKIS